MTVAGHRTERIREEIRNEVGAMLEGELKDPRLAIGMTVNEVRVSPDMRQVRIFVGITGTEAEQAETLKGLGAASGYIRHELVERLRLRRAPEISFSLDRSGEYDQRIEDLLRKAKHSEGS